MPIPRQLSPHDLGAVAHVSRRLRQIARTWCTGTAPKAAPPRGLPSRRPIVRAYTPHGGSLLLDHATLTGKAYLLMERR